MIARTPVGTPRSRTLRVLIVDESVEDVRRVRDVLQEAIAHVKKNVTDFPLQFGNFRD